MKAITFFTILLSFFNSFSQGKITISQAINIVSKQTMLTQRMAKDKIYKINKVNLTKVGFELNSSTILFNKNLSTLTNKSFNSNIDNEVFNLDLLWQGYKTTIDLEDKVKINLKLLRHSSVILNQCNKLYVKLLAKAKKSGIYPYNTKNSTFTQAIINNNDLKYLSQKLALVYTSYYYRNNKYNHKDFIAIVNEIDSKIDICKSISNLNGEIALKTDDLEYNWKTLKDGLTSTVEKRFISSNTSPSPEKIFDLCNLILNNSDLLGRTYKSYNSINQ